MAIASRMVAITKTTMSTKVLEPALGNRRRSPAQGAGAAARIGSTAQRAWFAGRPASRRGRSARAPVRCADVVVDPARQQATRAGRPIALTRQDCALLAFLMGQAGQVVTRQRLSRAIWRRAHDGRSNFVEVGMWRLRAKIDGPFEQKLIHAVRGVGYICAAHSRQGGIT